METLIHARSMFITRQCGDTHVGYAMSHIKKARGQNKWVNQPKAVDPPVKEDFCYVIPRDRLQQTQNDRIAGELATFQNYATRAPRPTKAHPDALDVILRQWAN